jgi:hypothetical protein
VEGLLFGAAGWHALTTAGARRRWVVACGLGVLAGIASGALGVRVG